MGTAHQIEKTLIDAGISYIAGVDEAGRGACAGPLVVAAVILKDPYSSVLAALRDSKQLSQHQREKLFPVIVEAALSYSIIEIPSTVIDDRGVHAANIDGMRRAVHSLSVQPTYVLTDGYPIPGLGFPTLGVWKGDQVAPSISAASILAKVTRDQLMCKLALEFPQYGFEKHKGYSTSGHVKALENFGPTNSHRRSFSNVAAFINNI
ncbi:MAG: ribonuclease HII [Actinomycetota bacterium]